MLTPKRVIMVVEETSSGEQSRGGQWCCEQKQETVMRLKRGGLVSSRVYRKGNRDERGDQEQDFKMYWQANISG